MTDEEAHGWINARFPTAVPLLGRLVDSIIAENERQNLIAPSTVATVWSRHVVDSLQLVPLVSGMETETWLDVGTGGGFPGLMVAVVWDGPVILVEPRRRRAEFLHATAREHGLGNVTVRQARVENVAERAMIVSARAVASIPILVDATRHVAMPNARWLLPRGRFDAEEQSVLTASRIVFHVEQSVTEEASRVVVIREEELAA